MHREKRPVERRIDEETTATVDWTRETLLARKASTVAALDRVIDAYAAGREPTTRELRAAWAAARALAARLDGVEPPWHEDRIAAGDPPELYD